MRPQKTRWDGRCICIILKPWCQWRRREKARLERQKQRQKPREAKARKIQLGLGKVCLTCLSSGCEVCAIGWCSTWRIFEIFHHWTSRLVNLWWVFVWPPLKPHFGRHHKAPATKNVGTFTSKVLRDLEVVCKWFRDPRPGNSRVSLFMIWGAGSRSQRLIHSTSPGGWSTQGASPAKLRGTGQATGAEGWGKAHSPLGSRSKQGIQRLIDVYIIIIIYIQVQGIILPLYIYIYIFTLVIEMICIHYGNPFVQQPMG